MGDLVGHHQGRDQGLWSEVVGQPQDDRSDGHFGDRWSNSDFEAKCRLGEFDDTIR